MRAPELRLFEDEMIVDNFAGGGGASLGIEMGLGRSPDIAINHDPVAIAMHEANHPSTTHYREDIWKVDPAVACKGREVGLAWFSPDCKHFSKAKGGKPVDKKIRGLAWVVIRWAKAVRPRVILLENVEEFEDWGPLLDNDKPDPAQVGLTFKIWRGKLQALGYKVEHRAIVAADHGTPTTRKRLYLIARRDGLPIVWPEPTHGEGREAWRTAAECIDWRLPTYSIFLTNAQARRYGVKRPLAENTLRRVARGVQRYVIDNASPFIVPLTHQGSVRVESIREPLRTTTGAHRGERAVVAPVLSAFYGDKGAASSRCRDMRQPIPTQTADPRFALIAPTLVTVGYGEREGQDPRVPGIDKPIGTIVAGSVKHGLVAAFMAQHNGGFYDARGGAGRGVNQPLSTITREGSNQQLVASSILKMRGTNTGQRLNDPLQTLSAQGNHFAEVRAFMLKYYGTDQDPRLEEPMHTLTARDRMGIVLVHGEPWYIADIGMRMLAPRELFRAQGFHDGYIIDPLIDGQPMTKDAQVRCVGNSVCPPVAAALARAQFEDYVIEVAA